MPVFRKVGLAFPDLGISETNKVKGLYVFNIKINRGCQAG